MTTTLDASIVIDRLSYGVATGRITDPDVSDRRFMGYCDAADVLLQHEPGYHHGDFRDAIHLVFQDLGEPAEVTGPVFDAWRAEFVLRVFQDLEARIW